MGAPISDKIRKIHDTGQTVRPGPSHAGVYISAEGNLMININEDDGPQQVDALEGDTLSAVKRTAQPFLSVYETGTDAIVIDSVNLAIYIGAYRHVSSHDLIATRETVMKIENLDDPTGGFAISIFPNQTEGQVVDEDAVGTFGFSASSENLFFGESTVEHGVSTQAVVAGALAGDITVTDVAVGDLLKSVIAFTTGVPADLTSEFSIGAGKINNTGGTDTTGKTLIVTYLDRTA